MNFIKKLINKLKGNNYQLSPEAEQNLKQNAGKPKLAKTIATLALASTLALTPLTLTACNPKTENPNPNPGIEKPITEYSQILQTVLTDDYYDNLIKEHVDNHWFFSNKIAAIPYSFLEKKGLNIEAIKNENLKCITDAYIEENNSNSLIVSVKAETENSSNNFYSCFQLKYNLSDKEYKDLYMLHKGRYIQAPFFIQEISKQKQPIILSETKISVDTYDTLLEVFNTSQSYKPYFNNKALSLDIVKITDANHITINVRNAPSLENMYSENNLIRKLEARVYDSSHPNITNGIYTIVYTSSRSLAATNADSFINNSTNATYFSSQNLENINLSYKLEI